MIGNGFLCYSAKNKIVLKLGRCHYVQCISESPGKQLYHVTISNLHSINCFSARVLFCNDHIQQKYSFPKKMKKKPNICEIKVVAISKKTISMSVVCDDLLRH